MAVVGEEEANRVVVQNLPLANWWAMRYFRRSHCRWGFEDYLQEAILGMVVASRRYDPDRGSFPAIAGMVIRTRLRRIAVWERFRGMHVRDLAEYPDVRFGRLVKWMPGKEDEPLPDLPDDFWETVARNLHQDERPAVMGFFKEGKTKSQLARMAGTSHTRVRQRIKRGLQRLSLVPALRGGLDCGE